MSQSGGEKNFNTTTNHHVYIKNPLKLFKKCSTEKDFGYHHWWHCRPFLAPPVWTWKFFVPSCNMNMGAHRSTFAKTRTFLFIDFKNAELVITNFSSIVSYFGEKNQAFSRQSGCNLRRFSNLLSDFESGHLLLKSYKTHLNRPANAAYWTKLIMLPKPSNATAWQR